jgi:hypothetical protein
MSPRLRETAFIAIIINMAIIAGALSFSTRPIPISESVKIQKTIWEDAHTYKAGSQSPSWLVRSNSGRLLVPAAIASLRGIGLSWEQGFSLVRLITIIASYLLFFYYLRGWFKPELALIGLLFMSATVPLTFSNWHELPTDFPELAFFTLAYWLLRQDAVRYLFPLVLVATLNRETAFLIPVLAVLMRWDRGPKESFRFAVLLGLAWLLPYVALRWWTGIPLLGAYGLTWHHNAAGLARLSENLNPFNQYLYYVWLLGPFWVLPLLAPRAVPERLWRALWLAPISAPMYLAFGGYLNEPRPLMHFYAAFVPASLFALLGEKSGQWTSDFGVAWMKRPCD